jgi:hypothetical protein
VRRAERARVETEGWGRRLLACQDPEGQWAGAAFWPPDVDWDRREELGQPWTAALREARRSGEEFMLARGLFRRLSTGAAAAARHLELTHPNRWRHDILRGLDHFRAASLLTGDAPDARLGAAVEEVRRRRLPDGRWPVERVPRGRAWFAVDDGEGLPSRWITLRALRVLRWWDAARG